MGRRKIRSQAGFTLIELLVVVIIIGILAAIALPNFIGAQDKAREASVKANMRTAQIAAEAYAVDNAGSYPNAVDAPYQSYFPGGKSDGVTSGNPPVNPFTSNGEWPSLGAVSSVQTARDAAPATHNPGIGKVEYSPITPSGSSGGATSYAIIGGNKDGVGLGGTTAGKTLVLSNQ